jgi:hypothetical protein
MNTPTAADLLRDASRALDEDGHTKGAMTDENGAHCAAGAMFRAWGRLDAAIQNDPAAVGAFNQARNAMLAHAKSAGYETIPSWNDDWRTLKEDVQKAFLAVADRIEFEDAA